MPLKIVFFSMDTAGHLNSCFGLAQSLLARGHRVIYLLNTANQGKAAAFGCDEILLSLLHPEPKPPIKQFAELILNSGLLGPDSPLEKLRKRSGGSQRTWSTKLYNTLVEFDPQIEKAVECERPDVIVVDHWLIPPSILKCGIPWVFLCSGGPLGLYRSDLLPPAGSGFSINSHRDQWLEFRELHFAKFTTNFLDYEHKLLEQFAQEEAKHNELNPYKDTIVPKSQYLNLYSYPLEMDYGNVAPLDEKLFFRVDAFCRKNPPTPNSDLSIPEEFLNKSSGKLIYFSLGTLASVDVTLMKRITQVLSKTPHRIIVSKGPLADEYRLPTNCWGASYLPQTDILPIVDLVITHGGNNTLTETFTMGKPMIVMPMFGDQMDNAARIEERGLGCHLAPYTFKDEELLDAIERMLDDAQLKQRLEKIAERIRLDDSKSKACQRIEALVVEKLIYY